MNAIQRDKCFVRRMVRAGCVESVGIVRARRMESTEPPTNAQRVSAWRKRSHAPGFGGYYVRPWKSKSEPIADCPQPDGREIDPRDVVQSMPAGTEKHDSPPVRWRLAPTPRKTNERTVPTTHEEGSGQLPGDARALQGRDCAGAAAASGRRPHGTHCVDQLSQQPAPVQVRAPQRLRVDHH